MAESTLPRRRLVGRLMFIGLALFIVFLHMIPLETVPPSLGAVTLERIEDAPLQPTPEDPPSETDADEDPIRWIAPDLLILLALVWVTRRPSFVPVIAIGAIFLLADFLFQKPPGLWAGLVVILSEILRARARIMRTLPFWVEWVTVGAGIAAITAIERFTLSMVLVPQAALGLTLVQTLLTIVAYPLVVFVSYALFGVNRPAPGEVDALGHRI